ncbi:MAG: DUF1801 domain-containing protein [Stappiaceae bacterium]
MPDDVETAFNAFPEGARVDLIALRTLIFETAEATEGAGEIVETLKWGQPSYLTVKPKSGTTIRLGTDAQDRPALFCHCQTTLISEFRDQFAEEFEFEKNRGLILKNGIDKKNDALAYCIGQALMYHRRK